MTDTDSLLIKSARSDVSDAIAEVFSGLDDEYNIRLGELRSDAFAQYDKAVEDGTDGFWTPYGLARTYEPARADENAVAVVMTVAETSGGPHPNDWLTTLNFDAKTGELLTLRDICAAGDRSLEEYINSRLAVIGGRLEFVSDFYEGWEETVSDLVLDDVWYFDDEGITIIVNRYIVAPYVYGPQFLTVPYGELTSLLKSEYMPPVHDDGEGTVLVSDSEPLGISSINRLVIDEAGKKFYFTTDGVVYDVRINHGWSSFETFEFFPGNDLYAVNRMTDDDCIFVSTYIPEILPDLMLTYVSGGVEQRFMIMESGEDGHVYLSPCD
ncbi:MAG: RsiV family protein [Oscillospiraceae bacterium]|nr:RsiV family protein [Oscillospiraceae bacterium]